MFRSISIYLTGLLLLIGTVSAVPVQNGGSVAGTLVARGGGNFGVVASHHAHHAVSHKAHAPPEPEVDARDVIGDEDSEILQRNVWHQASAAHARASHVHAAASRAHSAASSAWRAVGSHNRAGAHAAAATEHHHIAADHGASATFYHQQGNLQHPAVSANHAALSMHDAHESEQMGGHSHNAAVASYNDAQHRAARRH